VVSGAVQLARSLLATGAGGPGIGRLPAQQLARHELAKAKYGGTFGAQVQAAISRLLNDLLGHLGLHGLAVAGWTGILALAVLLVLAVAAVLFFLGPARRNRRWRGADLLEAGQLSATDHRRLAAELAAAADFNAAVIELVRALAAELEERQLLLPRPGRTATELAAEAGTALPDLAARLSAAAELFGGVRYGDIKATQGDYERTERLEADVRTIRVSAAPVLISAAPGLSPGSAR
jgi:Domain of unknown function (DUF4129)